ncbi:MAG: hypothetical protein RLO52_01390 [Sandaracinaceae bacterium]
MTDPDSARRALRHPAFVAALLLLVVNDHVLKGAELLPGWLTGKLSDFAGLIVAPLILTALLGARRRGVAFALVGVWFAAANLVPAVAEATRAVGASVGLDWHFVVDPTDLVALAVLPFAWRLGRREGTGHSMGHSTRKAAERLAVGFGVAASIASPTPEPFYNTAAYVVNDTDTRLELRVRYVESTVVCAEVRDRFDEVLPRDAYRPATRFIVEAGEVLPLDRALSGVPRTDDGPPADPFAPEPTPTVATGHDGGCDLIILSAEGLPETVIFWDGLTQRTIPIDTEGGRREQLEGGLFITAEADGALRLDVPESGYDARPPVDVYDGGARCRDYGTITGFDWSSFPTWTNAPVRLVRAEPTLDDCVSVELEDLTSGTTHEGFICVPPDDFPFARNAELRVTHGEGRLHVVRDLPLEDGTVWRTGELTIYRGVDALIDGPFRVSLDTVDAECAGVRMECGGFRVPAAAVMGPPDDRTFVHPGDVIERDAADGRRARLRVGRAETMWATHPACGAGRNQLGSRLEALVVYGEERR